MEKKMYHLKRWIIAAMIAVVLMIGCLPVSLQKKVGGITEVKAETTLQNPRIEPDESMNAGQRVTWDCVWFGSYPQTEIVDTPEALESYEKGLVTESDYEVNPSLYSELKSADGWNDHGDLIASDGVKYRKKSIRDGSYHYFRYDKIKWRVLNVSGGEAFLLADKALDIQEYNTEMYDESWYDCTLRQWLNYSTLPDQSRDYVISSIFFGNAFSPSEGEAIKTTLVINNDNIKYGTKGGNNTLDKVFLLSEAEVYTDAAKAYGFVSSWSKHDEARRCKCSMYAKALIKSKGCTWWLRSPGECAMYATYVYGDGNISRYGTYVDLLGQYGVRPALNLDLTCSDLWSYAGVVCSDETVNEDYKKISGKKRVSKIALTGISKKIAAGKKLRLKATVYPKTATNKKVKWTTSNKKLATVTRTGLVKIKKRTGGKTVRIIAKARDGSGRKAVWKIKIMKGAVKKIKVKGYKKTLKAGKTMKLKAKVKVTKGKPVNKKLKWTTSNKKYATVTQTGKVKALVAGKGKTVKIKVMSTDGTNKSVVKKIKIK